MARLTSLLLLGAIGASAHPSNHARFHNKHRQVEDRNIGDIISAVIDGVEVFWTQTEAYGAAAATPTSAGIVAGKPNENFQVAATSTSVYATTFSTSFATTEVSASTSTSISSATATSTSSSSSSSSSGSGVTEYTSFSDYCSSGSKKRATTAEIKYAGNTGEDSDYGCNIMLLGNSDLASKYDNTVKFFGGSSDMFCVVWNKIGSDGGVDGFFLSDTATTFTLAAGAEQYIALDANTQGGGACIEGTSISDVLTTTFGEVGMTWVEWDAQNSSNDDWSGADASCIVAQDAGLTVNGMQVCLESDSSQCSSISAGATSVDNAYTADLADADGVGLNIDGGLKITVNLGY
ncbi:hypothetical protein VPNG_05804 [Cytospora leucostoma]|uniref:Allergen Asp f 4 n=1 Tax=Cytospora leucostoma TaxID=1230097 RepID=A0A423X0B2_9PEZI|nr:hypothetical protein VPNG_05804 [Cytospora leucostoma]